MRKFARTRGSKVSSPALTRWGGAAACLAGLSYGAWGYLDNPDAPGFVTGAVLPVLKLTTPTLFLGGLVGLYSWLGGGGSRLTRRGLLGGMLGTVLGVVHGLARWPTLPCLENWLENWLILLFASLGVVGVAAVVFKDAPRLLGALVLASATLGWVSLLTDPAFPGVLVPMRAVHVAFAALFCTSAVVWGWALFSSPRSRTRLQP